MSVLHKTALVPYTPHQMFTLVNEVTAYPHFLPWCHSATAEWEGETTLRATIEIAHGALRKEFTTRNQLVIDQEIRMVLLEGPFKQLHGHWRFLPLADRGCKVVLDLDFEFSNRLVALAMGPIFNAICNSLVDAFVKQAQVQYG